MRERTDACLGLPQLRLEMGLQTPETERIRCAHSPGTSCSCGYWGLNSPRATVEIARATMSTEAVMGTVVGYGTVALHGPEGFRAATAIVTCLFSDEVTSAPIDGLWHGLQRRLQGARAEDGVDHTRRRNRVLKSDRGRLRRAARVSSSSPVAWFARRVRSAALGNL